MTLRAALVSVADIRAAGRDLRVARYAPSTGVDYAMFSGGGLAGPRGR
ncbi:adenylate cyclase protein [Rhodobacteraceae bacterium KLH11]|nr:adenylate cyclase protein [Rhodobacteraceae bacterium KLH11]